MDDILYQRTLIGCGVVFLGATLVSTLRNPPSIAAAAPVAQAASIRSQPVADAEPKLTLMFEGKPITYKKADFDSSWENCKLADTAQTNAQSDLTSAWTDQDGKIDAARRLRKIDELEPPRMVALCQAIAQYKIEH